MDMSFFLISIKNSCDFYIHYIQQVFQKCVCSLDIHVFCFSLFLLKTKDLNKSEKKDEKEKLNDNNKVIRLKQEH